MVITGILLLFLPTQLNNNNESILIIYSINLLHKANYYSFHCPENKQQTDHHIIYKVKIKQHKYYKISMINIIREIRGNLENMNWNQKILKNN